MARKKRGSDGPAPVDGKSKAAGEREDDAAETAAPAEPAENEGKTPDGRKTVVKYLPVKLDAETLAARHKQHAGLLDRRDEVAAEAKTTTGNYRKTLAELDKQAHALRKVVRSEREDQPVLCEERPDWQRKVVHLVRQDMLPADVAADPKAPAPKDAIVETRQMSAGELQVAFTFGKGNVGATMRDLEAGRGRSDH